MRISAVEEYGLRCLLALARKGPGGQLSISEIAELEGLSVPYASKLLAILRRAGLVMAERGRGGGFTIARDASQINLYEVLTSLGGPLIDPQHCQKHSGQLHECIHVDNCSVQDVLGGIAGYMQTVLTQQTLADLVDREKQRAEQREVPRVFIAHSALEKELERIEGRVPLE